MFGFVNRFRDERAQSDPGCHRSKPGASSPPLEDDEEEEMSDEAYARKARLCNIRKRSVEIPLESLLSGMIFLSGGRDIRDGPVLSIVQSEDVDIDLLMELKEVDILDMLSYFTFVPNEEIRSHKFSVVVSADSMYDFFLRNIIISLNTFQKQNRLFHCVYFLNSTRNIEVDIVEWAYSGSVQNSDIETSKIIPESSLSYRCVKSFNELFEFIPAHQLTSEFGGTLKYVHQDWVRFRMQVEPFICDVVGVSKRLSEAIAPFTQEDVPETVQEVEESLKEHLMQRRKTLETLHVEDLASEGEKIRERMNSPSKELLQHNPDFTATLETIEVLVNRVENVRSRLDTLWHARNERLEAKLKEKKFEQEANQILDWFEQYAEEFFETHAEIGESLDVAQALITELIEFEESTKQILHQTNNLLKNASELGALKHLGCDVNEIVTKVKNQLKEFGNKMEERKKRLNDAVQLHNIMEKSINWCIEGVEFLSTYDILSIDPSDIDAVAVKAQLEQFQVHCPPPKREEIKLLADAVSSMDTHWGKESFEFALNRIVELNDRFNLYDKLLNDMINPVKEVAVQRIESNEIIVEGENDSFESPPHHLGRRMSETGRELQFTVLDVDKRAQQALNLLEKTDQKVSKLDLANGEDENACNSSDSDCVSLIEFLSEVSSDHPPTQTSSNHLDISPPESRGRCYSAPDDMVDGDKVGVKRSRSFNRKSNTSVTPRRPISPSPARREISQPTNPQFEEEVETVVSIDDTTVEENIESEATVGPIDQESIAAQTAHAKHRRKLMEELLTTEEAYIKDLEHIINNYIPRFEDDTKLPPSLVGKKDILFCLLPMFLEFSKDIVLPRIKKCVRAPIKMGLVFLDYEEQFLNYALYFKNKPQQDELITNEDNFFRNLQEEIGDTLLMNAFLIKPVQRMTKYRQFLEQMVKFSTKGKELQEVQKGAKKEYFGKLKEALKMVDFVLRHGNDLLALECLKGFNEDIEKFGRILRVGDMTLIDGFTKHKRKVFLFEKCLLLSKTRKMTRGGPSGSEVYDYKQKYRTTELTLREQIPGHETRFALETRSKKDTIVFQVETVEEKQEWIQEIWDLFFSHMLSLKDVNLENYGTSPLTNVMVSGSATLTRGRPFSHSMRKRVHTIATNRKSIEIPHSSSRESLNSISSTSSLRELADYIRNKRDSRNFPSPYSPAPISPRSSLAVSFSDKPKRESVASSLSVWSSEAGFSPGSTPRSSMLGSPSSGTISSYSGVSNGDIDATLANEDNSNTLTRKPPVQPQPSVESLKMFNTPL